MTTLSGTNAEVKPGGGGEPALMEPYHAVVREVLEGGHRVSDRTGVGTRSVFGRQMRFDLRRGFPLLTTKKLHVKSIVHELVWFIRGETNVGYLREHGVSIWDEWADEAGELGPVYGKQWRSWATPSGGAVDQLAGVIEDLKSRPHSRRHIVSAWNPADVPEMALPPCHCLFQFYVSPGIDGGRAGLSCQLYQRSADLFLGVPFNIASYALLTHLVAAECGYEAVEFVHTLGDAHLYENHVEQARELLSREHRPAPSLVIGDGFKGVLGVEAGDVSFEGYEPHPAIKAPVAV